MIRTVGVKGSEPDHVRRAHPGQALLDVLYAGLLELGTPGWIACVSEELSGEESLADHLAPVAGRLGEDRT